MANKVYRMADDEADAATGAGLSHRSHSALTAGTNGRYYDSTKGPFFNLEADLATSEFEIQFNAYAIVCQ